MNTRDRIRHAFKRVLDDDMELIQDRLADAVMGEFEEEIKNYEGMRVGILTAIDCLKSARDARDLIDNALARRVSTPEVECEATATEQGGFECSHCRLLIVRRSQKSITPLCPVTGKEMGE